MKDYICSCGHAFNKEEVKQWTNIGSGATCPKCWPNGFLNRPERLSEKTLYDNEQEMRLEEIHFPTNE